jgi:hypothetical protein
MKLVMSTNTPAGIWSRCVLSLVSSALSASDKNLEEGFGIFEISLIE